MVTKEMVKGLLENDQRVIKYIYKKYFKSVEKFVTTNRGTKEDAWDIFQESMIIVFEKLRQNSNAVTTSFGAYLYSVCKYQWIRKLNESQMGSFEVGEGEWMIPELEFDLIMQDTEMLAYREKRDRIFQEAYISLSIGCRQLIDLVVNGCDIEEIKEYLDFTSLKYAFRKRQKCKERLMKHINMRINQLNN
ncbi:MAG: hypothetical protein Q8O68_00410 [Candidatus Daviesbacteria bacterium]|jgi:DNA-directed RNA polymerase specialized sigma24 family protein|nr:hypothetical protein [Candidatus Daviesbacteria bacterium]